jgi:periplasmic protein CpxP/Spy
MSKVKILIIAVISLFLLNIGLVIFTLLHHPPFPPPPQRGTEMEGRNHKMMIIEKLQFDAEQQAQYENLITEHQNAIKKTSDSIAESKNSLYHLLTADIHTTTKDSIIENIGRLQQKIELTHYAHFEAIKKICKPVQVKSFTSLTTELANFFPSGRKEKLPRR